MRWLFVAEGIINLFFDAMVTSDWTPTRSRNISNVAFRTFSVTMH